MCDDDIRELPNGFNRRLMETLLWNPDVMTVSARLLNKNREIGITTTGDKDLSKPFSEVGVIPTACCAFRNYDLKFDENFIGSGFEDTDFFLRMKKEGFSGKKILIDNRVKVVHLNEMKNQKGKFYEYNQKYFNEKYGIQNMKIKIDPFESNKKIIGEVNGKRE